MQFELVSPERKLLSAEATAVQIPGADGDMTAMPNHAATITTLRPGTLSVHTAAGNQDFVVTGGFAEINAEGTSVLAERAVPVSEFTQAIFDELMTEAVNMRDNADAEMLDDLAKRATELAAVASQLGLNPSNA
jgi:F-type H+-transporting ATPase subunit epsilon